MHGNRKRRDDTCLDPSRPVSRPDAVATPRKLGASIVATVQPDPSRQVSTGGGGSKGVNTHEPDPVAEALGEARDRWSRTGDARRLRLALLDVLLILDEHA